MYDFMAMAILDSTDYLLEKLARFVVVALSSFN
jgi:hypothetical protein